MIKKVGFIYLDELLHIHHFLSPAIELAKIDDVEVDILTYQGNHNYLKKLIGLMGGNKVNIVMLSTYLYRHAIERITKRNQPSALYIYKKHKNKLLQYDALVFTDYSTVTSVHNARGSSEKPLLCFVDHGAGDRAYSYDKSLNLFDLVMIAGRKKFDRLNRVMPDHAFKLKIGGYSKFDVVKTEVIDQPQFNNSNPVVLYVPHFSRELSSWYQAGESILNFFIDNKGYNLIFAPHFNLFNKKGFIDPEELDKKYFEAPNIYIDLGSVKSVNMTYTLNCDIYLGDASSQVYEFLYKSRPVIFFDAHDVRWENDDNFVMWKAGRVVKSIDELSNALLTVDEWSKKYEKEQKELFVNTFDQTDKLAGLRTAEIIKESI